MFYTKEQTEKIQRCFSRFFYHDEININQETGVIIAMYHGEWSESGKNRAINIYYNPEIRYKAISENSVFWEYSEEYLKQRSVFNFSLEECERRRVGDKRSW